MKKLTSTNFENQLILHSWCGAAFTLSLLSGRWKLSILTRIAGGATRFSTLKAAIPAITERVLALQLKEMEESGLLIKSVIAENARYYQYTLSEAGNALLPIIYDMEDWSKVNRKPTI